MAKPWVHAESSARRFGGRPEDYMDIHEFLDSSKGAHPDNRHRALTHNGWFLVHVIERVFGPTRRNSEGRTYSPRDVAEQHVAEDFGDFIPSASDFLAAMDLEPWMNAIPHSHPPSARKIAAKRGQIVAAARRD